MVRQRIEKTEEHQTEVLFIAVNQRTGCFITGDTDGLVKVWSKDKRVLLDFEFFEPPRTAMFLDSQFKMFLGHRNSVTELTLAQLNKSAVALHNASRQKPKLRLYICESNFIQTQIKFFRNGRCVATQTIPMRVLSCEFSRPGDETSQFTFDDVQVLLYDDADILAPLLGSWTFELGQGLHVLVESAEPTNDDSSLESLSRRSGNNVVLAIKGHFKRQVSD